MQDKQGRVERSFERYQSYDPNVWSLEFFDTETGGYVVVNRKRLANASRSKNEGTKYEKELAMAEVFALNGYAIEMLKEISGISSPDVTINGVPAELKHVKSTANIIRYAKRATRKQGAGLVLFKFNKMTAEIVKSLKIIKGAGIHGKYYIVGSLRVYDF